MAVLLVKDLFFLFFQFFDNENFFERLNYLCEEEELVNYRNVGDGKRKFEHT